MEPFFSVIIPTRNRPALLKQTITHALEQSFKDFELLVMDNSDRQEANRIDVADPRVRILPSAAPLSMPDNWERSLDVARGTYLMIISDKDMLVPGAMARIHATIRQTNPDLVNYRKAAFRDGAIFGQECSGEVSVCPTAPVLRAWFSQLRYLNSSPMIYNSAVRRDLVLSIRKARNRFFYGNSPDVASGALLMGSTSQYTLIDQILAVALVGPWSIGHTSHLGRQGAAREFLREFGSDPFQQLGLVFGLPGAIVETLLACKEAFPNILGHCEIAWPGYVAGALVELEQREREGIATADDRALLSSGVGKLYSRSALIHGYLRYWRWRSLRRPQAFVKWLRHRSPFRVLFPPYRRLGRLTRPIRDRLRRAEPSRSTSNGHAAFLKRPLGWPFMSGLAEVAQAADINDALASLALEHAGLRTA